MIEVSAFETKGDGTRIIKIDFIAFQLAYHDERLGSTIDRRAIASQMAGMAVANTNVEQGYGASAGMTAVPPAAPAPPPPAPAD